MTIRTKVIALLAALFAVTSAAQYLVQRQILLPSFAELERQAAVTNMDRVAFAMRNDLEQLEISARDWSNWDLTYAFAVDQNPTYLTENVTPAVMQSLKVNALAFVDLNGRFLSATGMGLDTNKPLRIDFLNRDAVPHWPAMTAALRTGDSLTGLVSTDRGPMLVAFSPVLNGKGGGPHRGMVLLGRLLTFGEVQRIGARAQVQLSLLAAAAPLSNAGPHATGSPIGRDTILTESDTEIRVERGFADIAGAPVLTMRIEVPRTISARGRETVAYASYFLLGAGAIALILLVLTLNRLVLSPLSRVTRHAVAIGHSDDLTLRLDLRRTDELGELATEIDRMMERLAAARRELVDQSFNAGIAELARELLHNIGNALTPVTIQMALLQARLRDAPVGDMEMLLADVGGSAIDVARRMALQEFLGLTGKELARVVTETRRDVDAMEMHMQTIKKLMSEQLSFSRSSRVIETVRLPELLKLAADGLPDAVHQGLVIEIDPTVETIGSIRGARATLQRVFQILMRHAAESARGAGSEKITLRVSSAVDAGAGGEQLELRFADDGAGLAPGVLTRMFEKGGSSPAGDGKFGAGLHWAANAIIALGGSIHAESPGLQGGTTIRLTLMIERPTVAAQAA